MAPCSYGDDVGTSSLQCSTEKDFSLDGSTATLQPSPVLSPIISDILQSFSGTIFPHLGAECGLISDTITSDTCTFLLQGFRSDRHDLPVEQWIIDYSGLMDISDDISAIDDIAPSQKIRQELARVCAELKLFIECQMIDQRRTAEILRFSVQHRIDGENCLPLPLAGLSDPDGNMTVVAAAAGRNSLPQSVFFRLQVCSIFMHAQQHSDLVCEPSPSSLSNALPATNASAHQSSRLNFLFSRQESQPDSSSSNLSRPSFTPSTASVPIFTSQSSSSYASLNNFQPQQFNRDCHQPAALFSPQLSGPTAISSASLCVSPKRRSILSRAIEAEFHFCGREIPAGQPASLGPNIVNPVPIRRGRPVNSSPLASPTNSTSSSSAAAITNLTGEYLKTLQSYRSRRRSSIQGSLIGSYEESILSGRLSAPPSKPIEFHCELGVLATGKTKKSLKCPPHVIVPFSASFYEWQQQQSTVAGRRSSITSAIRSNSLPAASGTAESLTSPGSESVAAVMNAGLRRLSLTSLPPFSPTSPPVISPATPCSERSRALSNASSSAFSSIADELGTPYVGTVDLEWGLGPLNEYGYALQTIDPDLKVTLPKHRSLNDPRGYWRIPPKGQLQVLIKNPSKSVIKVFLVPYDLRDMPASTKTFLRQKSFETPPAEYSSKSPTTATIIHTAADKNGRGPLRYAVHLQFACLPPSSASQQHQHQQEFEGNTSLMILSPTDSVISTVSATNSERKVGTNENRYYLHKSIRLVFGHRATDTGERLQIVYEMPDGRFNSGNGAVPPPVRPDTRYLPI